MWQVDNQTAYAAAATWVRDRDGAHHWNVVIKATFVVANNGRLRLADEQIAPRRLPEYHGAPDDSSLHHDADLGAMKPGTDVLVDGHAYAPNGEPQREVPIAIRFGSTNKVLLARGSNVYYDGLMGVATTKPEPFTRLAVVYERAFGGRDRADDDPRTQRFDARNPVGVGFMVGGFAHKHPPGPNFVYPGRPPAKAGPAGFGPIASHWMPRCQYAGTYDAAWIRERKPRLPEGYDERFMLSAPVDQRAAGYLQPGARIEVVNMTPTGVLSFELPAIDLRLNTRIGPRREEHGTKLVTVSIDTDASRVELVWQSALLVSPRRVPQLDETRVTER